MDFAIDPALGAFGQLVVLPNGTSVRAIVDYVESDDPAFFAKQVISASRHFTVPELRAADIENGAQILHAGDLHRIRHAIPEGHGLTALVTADAGPATRFADFDGDDFDSDDFEATYA